MKRQRYCTCGVPINGPTGLCDGCLLGIRDHATPRKVGGVPVESEPSHNPVLVNGERWITLYPLDEADERLWEFSLDSGRVIQTKAVRS